MIWLPAGGAKSPPSAETIARGEHYIRMEGKETYRFATRTAGVDGARRRSATAGLEPADIDLFIPHQANIRIIEAVAKGLDLPMDRMFVNLDRYGNTSAASVPIALAEAVNEGRVKVGDQIVHRRLRGRLHLGRGDDRVDRRPGPRDRRRRRRPGRGRPRPAAGRLGFGRPDPGGARRAHAPGPARSTSRSTTSSRASPSRSQHGGPRMIDLERQERPRHRRRARDRPGDRAPPRDPGRRRRVQLPRQRDGGRRDGPPRSRRSAGGRSRSRATSRIPRPPRRSSRPRSRRSARSTSSSTTPGSPATT